MAFPYTDLAVIVYAYMGADPTADPGDWDAPVDLSTRLVDEPIIIRRGRSPGQKTLTSGSCSLVLHNESTGDGLNGNAAGALTPDSPMSYYYGDWDVGTPMQILVNGVGSSPPYERFSGFVTAIDVDIIPGVGDTTLSVVRVTLGGIVGQRSQGSVPRSAMYQAIVGHPVEPATYWSLEDGELSTAGTVTRGSGGPMTIRSGNPAFGISTLESWLGTGLSFIDASAVLAAVSGMSALPTGVTVDFVRKFDGTGAFTLLLYSHHPDDVVATYNDMSIVFTPSGATITASQTDSSGTETDGPTAVAGLFDDGLHHIQFQALQSTADIAYTIRVDGTIVISASFTTATLRGIQYLGMSYAAGPDELLIQHVAIYEGDTVPSTSLLTSAMNGRFEQEAHDRVEFIAFFDRITFTDTSSTGRLCGYQTIADPLTGMREAETVDHGMLRETLDTWGMSYLSGDERYNLDAAMTIDLSTYRVMASGGGLSGVSSDVLTPIRNNQRLRNEWTVSRPDGGEATYKDEDHQSRKGRYNDSAEVNVASDDQLPDEASWRVGEGTYGGPRYQTFPLDLGANAADAPTNLLSTWLTMDLGDRIDRTNPPNVVSPNTTSVTLEGYTETIRRRSWTAALVVEPYDPWEVGELSAESPPDSNVHLGRAASERLCAIRAAIDSDDTAITIDPISRWTITAADIDDANYEPLHAVVGGELVEVTAIASTATTYVAASTPDHDDNAAVTPGDYAGGAAGNCVFVAARTRTATATLTITDPNYTFDLIGHVEGLYLWAAERGASAPNPTVTPSGGAAGNSVSAVTFGFTNGPVTLTDMADAVYLTSTRINATATQNIIYPQLRTGIRTGRLILLIAGKSDDWTSVAPPTGFTEAVDTSTTSGNDQGLYVAYRIDTSPTWVSPNALAVTGGATAVSEAMVVGLASGYETLTVVRSANSVVKSHSTGAPVEVVDPLIWAL